MVAELLQEMVRLQAGQPAVMAVAPELPATELAETCYLGMFEYCENLIKAPLLPAATLVDNCYCEMFAGCEKLNYIKCLATNIEADHCLDHQLNDIYSGGQQIFVKEDVVEFPETSSGIPYNWTVKARHSIVLPEGEITGGSVTSDVSKAEAVINIEFVRS